MSEWNRFARNALWFAIGLYIAVSLGLLTGCSLPLRKPEPYEQRTAKADQAQSDWDRQKRANADWWNCTRNHRVDEC